MAAVFSTRGGLVLAGGPPTHGLRPPGPPRARRGYGDYCFRARCAVRRATDGVEVGAFTGYDARPTIGQTTLAACRLETRAMAGHACDPDPEVVFLAHGALECTGQVFFQLGSHTRRVV